MCGIFGIIIGNNCNLSSKFIDKSVRSLFKFSESRGKEASGITIREGSEIKVLKQPITASKLIKSTEFKGLFNSKRTVKKPFAALGHSRLVTNGKSELNSNNQPIIKDGAIGIHNGVIVNDEKLWLKFSDLKRNYDIDTEIFLSILQMNRKQNDDIIEAVKSTYKEIDGSASVSVLFDDIDSILVATNTGSMYYCMNNEHNCLVFASEKNILNQLFKIRFIKNYFSINDIDQLKAGEGCIISLLDLDMKRFNLNSDQPDLKVALESKDSKISITDISPPTKIVQSSPNSKFRINDDTKQRMINNYNRIISGEVSLKRCTKCVLPETMPYINFDEEGVCNYCRNFDERGQNLKGESALRNFVKQYRIESGEPDCIVGFSGGRDSAYGIDYVKNNLGLHPIAFTYDWAMVNDLARRNQARIVSRLGVEQIIVSADIKKKREYIRKNLSAWLKKPELGMVPLLMAGDKQFYYYFHEIRKQTGVKLFIFCGGHEIEETAFKYGFCGVDHGVNNVMNCLTGISRIHKFKMLLYFAKQYLTNPSYINSSIFDTLFAYYCTYLLRDDYLYLYHYIEWDEKKILSCIKDKFDWEYAKDTNATWRTDDGTAAFYNYIYLTMAGFTEFDNFRSYQIREGKLTRDEAIELIKEENKPRFEAIEWYAEAVGIDINEAIKSINQAPKLYKVSQN